MYHSSKAITLSLKRYTDSSFIAKAYTEQQGLVTFFIRANKKQIPSIRNKFGILNHVKIDYVKKREHDSLSTLKEINSIGSPILRQDIHQNALKSLMAEMLGILIKEGNLQPELYVFIEKIIALVEQTNKDYVYVSIYFCVRLFDILGVSILKNIPTLNALEFSEKEIQFLENISQLKETSVLAQSDYPNLYQLFDKLIEYFKLEFQVKKTIQSIEIFRTIFYD